MLAEVCAGLGAPVLWQGDDLIGLHKPSGPACQGAADSLAPRLGAAGQGCPPVHRLDGGTPGVWLLAQTPAAARASVAAARLTAAIEVGGRSDLVGGAPSTRIG